MADSEDEYQWLEGPHVPQHTTVADLLDRRRNQTKKERRLQGHTSLREDRMSNDDPHGKQEADPKSPPKSQGQSKEESEEGIQEDRDGGDDLTL